MLAAARRLENRAGEPGLAEGENRTWLLYCAKGGVSMSSVSGEEDLERALLLGYTGVCSWGVDLVLLVGLGDRGDRGEIASLMGETPLWTN